MPARLIEPILALAGTIIVAFLPGGLGGLLTGGL
jgi:hypothetical protein